MRVWQAQIGLKHRVHNQFYNYVEITPHPRMDMGAEMPNWFLMIYLTGRKKKEAGEFALKMINEAKTIAQSIRSVVALLPVIPAMEEAALEIVNKSFNDDECKELKRSKREIVHALTLGVCLGELDQERRGEQPVVALGIHDEARKVLQELPETQILEFRHALHPDTQILDVAHGLLVQRGFFGARAGLLKKAD